MLWIVATLGVAVLAFGGLTHLRHQLATAAPIAATAPAIRADQATRVRENFAALPLAFEANQGQTNPQVKYLARGSGYTVFLTQDETVFALHSSSPAPSGPASNPAERARLAQKQINSSISMKLAGGSSPAEIAAQNELPGRSNYFIGSDSSQWHTGVKQYSRVSYRDVYPGVDMAFHGQQRQLEFDFIVAPNANAAQIGFNVSGAEKLSTDADGNLVLASKAGNVLLHKPVAYQEKNNTRQPVDASFVVEANNKIAFTLGNYDRARELVIDPSVTYATYLGGTGEDDAYAIAVDGSGNAYVTGQTASTNFPNKNAKYTSNQGGIDAFVSEISADGQTLEYSTYLGGNGTDSGNAIAVDASGNAYVAGGTSSTNFPAPAGYQTSNQGGLDAFVTEVTTGGGALTFSTYLGGTGDDVARGIAVDTTGVYVVGKTTSGNFPGVINGFQTTLAGGSGSSNGFVAELNTSGSVLAYSSYLGGGNGDYASSVAIDSNHQAHVAGATLDASTLFPTKNALQPNCGGLPGGCGGKYDAFVTVVNPATTGASSLIYSTFFGGTGDDQAYGIAVDGSGDAYITGFTQSIASSFPLQNPLQSTFKGSQDAFVAEINSSGSALVYSTYLGGSLSQTGTSIAVDGNGRAYVTGPTTSTDFPTAAPTQANNGGGSDAFVSEIAANGASLVFSTYLGGSLTENSATGAPIGAIAVDSAGANIYVTGNTAGNFPTASPEQSTFGGGSADAFVAAYSTGASTGSFTITNGALSNTSGSPGVLSTATITVTPAGGFNSPVTLSCGVTPAVSNGPTCGFTGNPVANGSGTATLNVATTKASARLDRPNGRSGMIYAMILPVFGLALVGAGFGPSGSRRRKLFGILMIGIVLSGLLLLPACSSNSNSGGGGGTPAGTYTITVTGSGGGATATGTPALTLTVN